MTRPNTPEPRQPQEIDLSKYPAYDNEDIDIAASNIAEIIAAQRECEASSGCMDKISKLFNH